MLPAEVCMRVAITGATGLVGANLANLLTEGGHEVLCTRRASSRAAHLAELPIQWVEAHLGDQAALARAFNGCELVFHCAASVDVSPRPTPEQIDTNVEGTRRVLGAARQAGVRRVVHCSSVVAIGLSETGEPIDETATWNHDKFGLDDGYAITKRDAEAVVREAVAAGQDAVMVNPTYMFGPFDSRPSSGRMIIEVARGRALAASSGFNNFADVRAVVRGMWAAAERGRPGERYILGGRDLTYFDAFSLIAEVVGARKPSLTLPKAPAMAVGYAGDLLKRMGFHPLVTSMETRWGFCQGQKFRSDKAIRELGYDLGDLPDAIRQCHAWFLSHGMLP